jgi:hypothetical protein
VDKSYAINQLHVAPSWQASKQAKRKKGLQEELQNISTIEDRYRTASRHFSLTSPLLSLKSDACATLDVVQHGMME